MADRTPQAVLELLVAAASQMVPAPDQEPWDYGWCVPDYRHSADAAMSGPDGPVTFTPEGLAAWEEAATRLLRDRAIQDRFNAEESWSVLGSMTVAASNSDDPVGLVSDGIERLRTCGPALTVVLVANVAWGTPPLALGDFVIGNGAPPSWRR